MTKSSGFAASPSVRNPRSRRRYVLEPCCSRLRSPRPRSGSTVLPGEQAFSLHDTYGFPIDLTLEMASEQGLEVDEEGFRTLMAQQRERAKADAAARKSGVAATTAYRDVLERDGSTLFVGYNEVTTDSVVVGIVTDGESTPVVSAGQHAELIVDRTPFYAEAGGQLGDQGFITTADDSLFEVYDVQSPVPGLFVHRGKCDTDRSRKATPLSRRWMYTPKAISRAHTATHMIHRAFREQLGGETARRWDRMRMLPEGCGSTFPVLDRYRGRSCVTSRRASTSC